MKLRPLRLLVLATVAIVLYAMPATVVDHGPSLCLISAVSGHECPGCGMTRALMHALHGDLAGAWMYNWRWVLVAPLLLYGAVRWMYAHGRSRHTRIPGTISSSTL